VPQPGLRYPSLPRFVIPAYRVGADRLGVAGPWPDLCPAGIGRLSHNPSRQDQPFKSTSSGVTHADCEGQEKSDAHTGWTGVG
jgi:hypothetical protein